jgi:hypothetical protein
MTLEDMRYISLADIPNFHHTICRSRGEIRRAGISFAHMDGGVMCARNDTDWMNERLNRR